MTARGAGVAVTLLIVLLVAGVVSLNVGYARIPLADVLRVLSGEGDGASRLILTQFRLPRIVLAMLAGAGLALSGAVLQAVTRNGLADPGILGINAGAGLGVVAYLGFASTMWLAHVQVLPILALTGGLAAAVAIYALAVKRGAVSPTRLLLVGIAVNAGLAALMLVLSLRMDRQVYGQVLVWLAGSIAGKGWSSVAALVPWTLVLVPLTLTRADLLNVLSLGDALATGLGAAVQRQRLLLVALAVALAASAVSIAGAIGFVGLVAPHLARRLVGPNHRASLLVTSLVGALLVLVADAVARSVMAPAELPVGVVVAVIGAPTFLVLLVRSRGT